MFESLIESLPRRRRSAGASAGSLVVHSVVVLAAVLWTAGAPTPQPQPPNPDTPMVFVTPAPPAPPAPIAPTPPLPGGPPLVPELPDPDLPGPLPMPDSTPVRRPATDSVALTRPDDPGVTGPIAADLVDQRPELLTAAAPRYPEPMRMVGVTGRVVVGVVVDTTGRPERGSLRVVSSTHPGFDAAALAYVAGALFRPGRMWGRAVRVTVTVPIAFRLVR